MTGSTGTTALQTWFVIVLLSKVTAPVIARSCPLMIALLFAVIDWSAYILPENSEFIPKVAELPTCQNVLHAFVFSVYTTLLSVAVTRVDSIWKMNSASSSPLESSVKVPVISKVPDSDL